MTRRLLLIALIVFGLASPASAQVTIVPARNVFTDPVKAPSGTAAAPGWTYSADPASGCYLIGTSNIGCSAGGTLRWDYNTTRILSTIPLGLPSGTVGAVALYLNGETATGFYRVTTNEFAAAAQGSQIMRWTGGGTAFSILLAPNSDNSIDLGTSSARVKSGYFGTSVIGPLFRSDSAKVLIQGTGTGATQFAATQTTPPTCSANCGTTVPAIVGTDTAGIVTMGSGGVPASGWVVTFNGTWAAAPACTVQPALAGMAVGKIAIVVATTTTTFTVTTNGTAPSVNDKYAYTCVGIQ